MCAHTVRGFGAMSPPGIATARGRGVPVSAFATATSPTDLPRLARASWVFGTMFFLACGGVPSVPPATIVSETAAEPLSAGLDAQQLSVALMRLCEVAQREIVDRSRPAASRLRRVEARFDRTPYEGTLDEFFHQVETHAELRGEQRFPPFESVRAVAANSGVSDYQCEEFEQLLAFVRAGETDLDRNQAPTPIQDLGRLCDVAVEAEAWGPATESFGARFERRVQDELANPEVRQRFSEANISPPVARYSALRTAAAELGMPNWACPPLERAFLRVDEEGARAEAP